MCVLPDHLADQIRYRVLRSVLQALCLATAAAAAEPILGGESHRFKISPSERMNVRMGAKIVVFFFQV